MLAKTDLPTVVSTSFADDEETVPKDYAVRVCNDFMTLGARGVSLLFASGDGGVGNPGKCYTNDGKHTPAFLPTFPAGCP
jgi:tripeptidyl-peptidase-1